MCHGEEMVGMKEEMYNWLHSHSSNFITFFFKVIKARKSRTKNSQSCFKYGNFTNTSFAKAWMPGWGCK
jgi:hypothetical protein